MRAPVTGSTQLDYDGVAGSIVLDQSPGIVGLLDQILLGWPRTARPLTQAPGACLARISPDPQALTASSRYLDSPM
ncbi:MAG: hypothetical protein ACK4MS_16290, partial [Paracoccaceae bacterium]